MQSGLKGVLDNIKCYSNYHSLLYEMWVSEFWRTYIGFASLENGMGTKAGQEGGYKGEGYLKIN